MSRTGKIARLPHVLREQVSRRLQDGEPGKQVVAWLNALPEAQAVLAREFGARPVSQQNLSEWKAGGYCDWEQQQAACRVVGQLVEEADALQSAAGGPGLGARLATVLTAELARQIQAVLSSPADAELQWRRLREALEKLAQLRREESNSGRLELERERWAAKRKESERKAGSDQTLLPIWAAMMQHQFHELMVGSSPGAQAVVLETLDRLGEKRRIRPPAPFKPFQGKSSQTTPANQSESDQIKPHERTDGES